MKKRINWKKFFWENKEGIITGAIVGFVISKFFLPESFDFSVIQQSYGLIDIIKGTGTSVLEIAKQKVIIAFTIIGASVGLALDMNVKEGEWKKWL